MIKQLIWILLLAGIFALSSQSQENSIPADQSIFEHTDAYLEKMMDSLEIVGLNYAILIDHKPVHQKAFGLASLQLQVPMTQDNSFPVASISKLFSSVALHNLLSIHHRSVDETVGELLPERNDLPESWRKITLKQLLSHTSGIPDQIDYHIYLAPESEQAVIGALRDKPFSSAPGTESKYNATGFLLVRIIIEKLANQDFESFMQEQYFDPLGLNSADYGGFKKVVPGRVTCYHNVNGQAEMFPLNYSPPMYAGAGLNITINDLITWFQAVLNEQLLTGEQLDHIWTPVKLNDGTYGSFGLGWEAYILPDHYRMVGHGGAGISSFRHYWNEQTSENMTVILLTNGAKNPAANPNQINAQLANILLTE